MVSPFSRSISTAKLPLNPVRGKEHRPLWAGSITGQVQRPRLRVEFNRLISKWSGSAIPSLREDKEVAGTAGGSIKSRCLYPCCIRVSRKDKGNVDWGKRGTRNGKVSAWYQSVFPRLVEVGWFCANIRGASRKRANGKGMGAALIMDPFPQLCTL